MEEKSRQIIWTLLLFFPRPTSYTIPRSGERGGVRRHIFYFTTTANPVTSRYPVVQQNHNLIVPCTGQGKHFRRRATPVVYDCSSMFRTGGWMKMKITLKRKRKYTTEKKETQENVQIDMSVKKYCAFGCPVYTVYNIQSSCVEKKQKHALWDIRWSYLMAPGECLHYYITRRRHDKLC